MAGTFSRIYLGDASPAATTRIMEAVRAEFRSDELSWYRVQQAVVGRDDHPCNPGHKWVDVEIDNEEVN